MLKKLVTLTAAVAITLSMVGSAFAAFEDLDLIRVVYERTTGTTEQVTDLGNVKTILAGGTQTFAGAALSANNSANLFAAYFAIDRTGTLGAAGPDLWVSGSTAIAPVAVGTLGFNTAKSGATAVYNYYNIVATNGIGDQAATGSYRRSLSASQGAISNAIDIATRVKTEESLESLVGGTSGSVTQILYLLDNANLAKSQGVAVATITTNFDGSTTISKTTPSPPTIGTATRGNSDATITFTAPLFTGTGSIASYTVTSAPDGKTATGSASPITVTGLANGTDYTFTVTATNGSITSAPSAQSNSVRPGTPDAPTNVTASPGNTQATVSFTVPETYGGTITGYTVTSSDGITATGPASPITVTGLTNDTPYTFTVTATTNYGTGPASDQSNSVTPSAVSTFAVSFASSGNGTLTGATSQAVNSGADATAVTAVPDVGYHFVNWTGTGGFATSTSNPLTVTNVTADQAITANFAIDAFAVSFASAGNGTLTGTASQTVNYGADATAVTAVPDAGYHFVNWTGTGGFATSTSNPLTVTNVTAAQTITANFAIDAFAVSFASAGNGTLTGTASQTVNYGADATAVTAVPDAGYHFVNWTGTGGFATSTSNPLTVTNVTAAQTIAANFAIDTFTVSFATGGNGTLTGTASQTVNYGASATAVTAVPSTGYRFVNWTGTGGFVSSTSNPLTVTNVTAAQTITANFAINTFAVSFASAGNGTLTGTASQTVNYGADATAVTAVPAVGYHFVNWTGTGGFATSTSNPLTVTNVTAAQTIAANFAINSYTVTPSIGIGSGNGSITPSIPQSVNYNGTTTFTVTPNSGYVVTVTGTCGGTLAGTTYTTNAVTSHCTVIANFSNNNHDVTASAGANGNVSPAIQAVADGAAASINISPAPGYSIALVNGTCGGSLTGAIYTTNPVTANCTVNATFSINIYAVNFTADGNGTLTGSASQTVNYGASATAVTAVPSTGYHFVNWTGTGGFVSSTSNPLTVTNVTADQAITANFAIDTFAVSFATDGNGTLTGSASQTVNYGADATAVTAVPSTGYRFVNWTGTGGFVTSTSNPLTVTNVTAAQTITANFAIDTFAVSFATGGNGTLTGSASQTVNYGADATAVTAVPSTSYRFVNWTGTGGFVTSTSNPLTVTNVTAAQTITANFAIDTFAVSFASAGNGTLTGTASQTVNYGADATAVTAVPSTGYRFVNWTGTGGFVTSTSNPLTVTNVTAAQAITANFAIDTFAVSFATDVNGTLTGSANQTVNYGASATAVTAVPSTGYRFVNWTGTGGFVTSTSNPLTITNVTAAQTITANFAKDTKSVTASVLDGNGTITPSSTTINYGDSATLTISPAIGYHLVTLTDNGTNVTGSVNSGSYIINNVTVAHNVVATFAKDIFAVSFASGGNGTLTGTASQTVNFGASTTAVTAVPAVGYHFVNWTGTGGFFSTTDNPLTVTNVTAAQTIIANFSVIPPITFTVFPTFGPNGSISPAANQTVIASATTSFVVTPDTGHQISTVTGCGGTLSGSTYTTAGIIRDCSVSATFIATPKIKGDLNGTGTVDISDALLALHFTVGLKTPTADNRAAGDVAPLVNGTSSPDGKIDIADTVAILQFTVGNLTSW